MRPSMSLMAAISGRIALMSRSCLVPKIFAIIFSMDIIEPPVLNAYTCSGTTIGLRVGERQQRSWARCCDRGEKGTTVWLDTIQSECLRGVSARAAIGKTACGEGRSARTFRADDSAIGVTTDSSRRVRELDLCSFDTAGPEAMAAIIAADTAERPSSGANVTRMIRPNRTEVLLLLILALVGQDCSPARGFASRAGRRLEIGAPVAKPAPHAANANLKAECSRS